MNRNIFFLANFVPLLVLAGGCVVHVSSSNLANLRLSFGKQTSRPVLRSLPDCKGQLFVRQSEGEPKQLAISHEFSFEGRTHKVVAAIDEHILLSAAGGSAQICEYGWGEANKFYRAMVDAPSLEPFFSSVLSQLRAIRAKYQYRDAIYVELLVRFVQSLDYCEQITSGPKQAAETYANGCGDCDEKSVLLAGLLSREGFDVVLLVFERHMAVGIKNRRYGFQNSGYAYLETTAISMLGRPDASGGDLYLDPIPVGDGAGKWVPNEEQEYRIKWYRKASRKVQRLARRVQAPDVGTKCGEMPTDFSNTEQFRSGLLSLQSCMTVDEWQYVVWYILYYYIGHAPYSNEKFRRELDSLVLWTDSMSREPN